MDPFKEPKVWIKDAIDNKYIKKFDHKSFKNIKLISKEGNVKRAYLKKHERNVVLKYLRNDKYNNESDFYKKFSREVRNLNCLNVSSENITKFLGIGEDPSLKLYYMVLLFERGEDLRTYLQAKFLELNWPAKKQIALDITNGLGYIHNANIVHGNLNSKNILVHDDTPVIIGFGSSISLDEPDDTIITSAKPFDRESMVYVDPRFLGSSNYKRDKSLDIYSLGILLWEISSGRPPFNDKHKWDESMLKFKLISGILEGPINGTPVDYKELYCKTWNGLPEKRPLVEDVKNYLKNINFDHVYQDSYYVPEVYSGKNYDSITACLVVVHGYPKNSHFFLGRFETFLGRDPTNHIVIKDQNVSRNHAKITNDKGKVSITNLDSSSEISINDDKLIFNESCTLKIEDSIRIGNCVLQYLPAGEHENRLDSKLPIFNARYLEKVLENEFKNSKEKGSKLSFIFFDVDHFKEINDSNNHDTGDYVLKELVNLIKNHHVHPEDVFARFGGDEFVLLLMNTNAESAYEIAEKIRKSVEAHSFMHKKKKLTITLSIGVAEVNTLVESSEILRKIADEALCEAKRSGRNQVIMWDLPDANRRIKKTLELPEKSFGIRKPLVILTDQVLTEQLKTKQLENLDIEQLTYYINLHCKNQPNDEQAFNLLEKVNEFLQDSNKKVLLLTGDAGAGKSTFTRKLAHILWQKYKDEGGTIPLFISLPTLKDPVSNLVHEYLKDKGGFSEEDIRILKNRRFTFILDGYDEINTQGQNIYVSNKFEEWQVQVIVSCRTENLNTRYKDNFCPYGYDDLPVYEAFQKLIIAPFSQEQIDDYIKKHVEIRKLDEWDITRYQKVINGIQNLQVLLSNPFILKITMEVLPDLERSSENSLKLTRLDLYHAFMDKWFGKAKVRMEKVQALLDDEEKKIFTELNKKEGGFLREVLRHIKTFALKLYEMQQVIVTYYEDDDDSDWKAFFGDDPKTKLLRSGYPLKRIEYSISYTEKANQYSFLHKSLLEYFIARAIYESKFERDENAKKAEELFFNRNFIGDHGVICFLVEYVQQEETSTFKDKLLGFISKSKRNETFQTAAANAITILTRAGQIFSGWDLNHIRVPGADLSYGVFDQTQFEWADLRNVNFQGTWLKGANFSEANMSGVQFGEMPFLENKGPCHCCCYSSDGKFLAVASETKIYLYDVGTLENILTFKGHTKKVTCISISPDGTRLASGSYDETVRLWSFKNPDKPHVLRGHNHRIRSVAFSPNGTQLASGCDGKTVRLWSLETLDQAPRILEYTSFVNSVAFSPDGTQLASGSADKKVRLWYLENLHQSPSILEGHDRSVTSVAFSSDGTQLVSGSDDCTVRLWSLKSLNQKPLILEHNDCIYSVSISSDGTQLASGSADETVRLWSLKAPEQEPRILEGHTKKVISVAISPDGTQLASGSSDGKVRLWSIKTPGRELRVIEGHTATVNSIAISPNGTLLASGSDDLTVRLWSIITPDQKPRILKGHTYSVSTVIFSPDGTQLASASGPMSGKLGSRVLLWSLETLDQGPVILEGHTRRIKSIAFSPDGTILASGSSDRTVRLWSLSTLDQEPKILKGHKLSVNTVAFSPDGTKLASGSNDKTVLLWSLDTPNQAPYVLVGHTNHVDSLVFSPDGAILVSGSKDCTVRLWLLKDLNQKPHILTGHTACVYSIIISPDGTQLVSSSEDCTMRLWSMISGHCLAIVHLPEVVCGLAWKVIESDNFLFTGGKDKVIRWWRVERIDDRTSRVILHWTSYQAKLWLTKAFIQNVRGLSSMNTRLLKQRGAIDENDYQNYDVIYN